MPKPYYRGPKTKHFNGRTFTNPKKPFNSSFKKLLKWQFNANRKPWPKWIETEQDIPPRRVKGKELRVSFVNHATVLIQTEGLNILTDPIWSKRCSPIQLAGPKRVHAPGIDFDDLPPIDIVLLSHAHYDHLDLRTLNRLHAHSKPVIYTGLGVDAIVRKKIPQANVIALDWNDSVYITKHVKLHFLESQHWANRNLFDTNFSLWGAFAIETPNGNIYFAGDTGYNSHFKAAKKKFSEFRFAIIPYGSYDPRWFLEQQHMDPTEAMKAHKDLNSKMSLGMHHGTFRLTDTGYQQGFDDFLAAREKQKISEEEFFFIKPGEFRIIP